MTSNFLIAKNSQIPINLEILLSWSLQTKLVSRLFYIFFLLITYIYVYIYIYFRFHSTSRHLWYSYISILTNLLRTDHIYIWYSPLTNYLKLFEVAVYIYIYSTSPQSLWGNMLALDSQWQSYTHLRHLIL